MTRAVTGPELIDVHTHVVPHAFPANPSPGANARWPCLCRHGDDRAVVEIAGKAFRELDARSWDAPRRIADMERDGLAAQVLSPMPELLSYWFSAADGLEMARHVNGFIAGLVDLAPAHFHGLGMVPLQDVALAAAELSRLRDAGLRGVEIGSNVNGDYLGLPRFDEFWAEAERLDLAVFVHALHPVAADRLATFPDLVPFAAFAVDTGLSAITLVRAGVPQRFPRLRFGFSHGGGALAPLAARLGQGWRLSDGFDGALTHAPLDTVAGFWLDSLVYDHHYLDYLASAVAPGRIVAGSDYPYAIEQRDLAAFIDAARATDAASVNHAALAFLGIAAASADGD